MNLEEKRKLANEKRLNAVKQWKRNRTFQKSSAGTHVIFDDQNTSHVDKKVKLFDSDSEDEKYETDFNIKPQFEGKHGRNLLEMSSDFSDRFKLDERFKDEEETVEDTDKNEERTNNLKILESVLGHQVNHSVSAEKFISKKKQIRFDPDDVNASNCLKISTDNVLKKKPSKKKEKVPDVVEEEIPISEERYIEVSSDLKDILSSSAGTFSLTKKFNLQKDLEVTENSDFLLSSSLKSTKTQSDNVSWISQPQDIPSVKNQSASYFGSRVKEPFFLVEDDFRLKEGVEFFIRPKPLEEIQEDWSQRRNSVLELFKKKKRSGPRTISKKSRNFKNNFRKNK
ncbi:nucleolar protein 8-like [Uloborus diversus]|uniref:nucleolar protein 8-like n=1 Tax=Uloborus diversus TaxID=327109 RepID=UPI00240A0E3A|nr:nucleolar protein 8-like [Uloborus diversus]